MFYYPGNLGNWSAELYLYTCIHTVFVLDLVQHSKPVILECYCLFHIIYHVNYSLNKMDSSIIVISSKKMKHL